MKKIVIALLLISTLGAIAFYAYQLLSHKPFHCDAQMFARLSTKDDEKIEVNTHIDIIYSSAHNGIMKFSGSVKDHEKSYVLRRTAYFTIAQSELENVNKVVFTRTESHPVDNLPDDLWLNRVLPQTPGIEFYSKIRALEGDAIIFKGFSNPLLICIRR